jgi:hypothetical protein
MYPDWIVNLFTNNACPKCRHPITLDNVDAIGVGRPDRHLAHLREPMAMMLATCPQCEELISFSCRCATVLLLDAARELARLIENAPAGDPPLFGPGSLPPSHGDETPKTVRPSIRRNQAAGPLTDAEVKSLLARRRRASFRSGSKNFKGLAAPDQDHDRGSKPAGGSDE